MMVLFLLAFLSYFHITYSAQSVLGECEFKRNAKPVPCHSLVIFMHTTLETHIQDIEYGGDFLQNRIWFDYSNRQLSPGEYICNTLIKSRIDEINEGASAAGGSVVHPNCQWEQENVKCVGEVIPDDINTILKWDDICASYWYSKQTNNNIDEICDECDKINIGAVPICQFALDPKIDAIIAGRRREWTIIESKVKERTAAINHWYNSLECYNRNGFDKLVELDEEYALDYQGKYGYTKSGTQNGQRPYFDNDLETIQSMRLEERQQAAAASVSKGKPETAASASTRAVHWGPPQKPEQPIIHQVNRRNKFGKSVVLDMIGQLQVFWHTYKDRKDLKLCTAFSIGNGWFLTAGHCPTATALSYKGMPQGGQALVLRNSIDHMFYTDGRHIYRLHELCVPIGFMTLGEDPDRASLYDFAIFKIGTTQKPGMAIGFNDDAYFKNPKTALFAAGYPGEDWGAVLQQKTEISIGPFSFADALNQENLDKYRGVIKGALVQDRVLHDVTREGEKGESGAPLFGYDRAQNVVYGLVSSAAITDGSKFIGETFFRFTKKVFFQIQQHCGLEIVELGAETPVFQIPADLTAKQIEQHHIGSGTMDEDAMADFLVYIKDSLSTQIYQQLKPGDNTVGVAKYFDDVILPLAKRHMAPRIFKKFKVSIKEWKTRNQFHAIKQQREPQSQKKVASVNKQAIQNCVNALYTELTNRKRDVAWGKQTAENAIEGMFEDPEMTDKEKRECAAQIYDKIRNAHWRGSTTKWGVRTAKKVILELIGIQQRRINERISGRIDQDNLYYYDTNKMYPKLEESLIRQEMMEIRKAKQQKQRKRDYFY